MKTISKPTLQSARSLTPQEMNHIHFSAQRTVLTPQLLARIASQTSSVKKAADGSTAAPDPPQSAPISAAGPGDTEINFG